MSNSEIFKKHLSKFKDKPITLIQVGNLLKLWPTSAKIISVDIRDQGDPKFWDDFLLDKKFDVFVDNGENFMQPQILTFEKVFPKLNIGGIYINNNCHTSYMPERDGGFRKRGTVVDGKKISATFIEYAKRYIDMIHHKHWEPIEKTQCSLKGTGKHLTGLFFYDSVIVWEKFGK